MSNDWPTPWHAGPGAGGNHEALGQAGRVRLLCVPVAATLTFAPTSTSKIRQRRPGAK